MVSTNVKLAVENVSKTFRVRGGQYSEDHLLPVLRRVSFDVYEGEIVSLIGESGCGKTTLLRIIQGLVRRDAGEIRVDGKPVAGTGRDRGFVFQQANLLPWRSARANVEFGLELQRVPRRQRGERAQALLKLVGLGAAGEQFPHQLSGGMQQRVNLARAVAIDPAILLMDEPFSALDAQTREILQLELLRVQAETGKTTLFVTHDLDEAIYLSNRIVVMGARPGRIKRIMQIPFFYPRKDLPELRDEPEFQEIRRTMWELIRNAPPIAA
jgi:NitT/TauT family transport system ATP-binding protein